MIKCEESKGQFDKATYTYKYDEAGNRTFAKKTKLYSYLESWQMTYTYNADNQMTAATVCEGNLTKKYTFVYDANGNLTKECYQNCAETSYQYDTENRLRAVYDKQKLLMAAAYDGDGNRTFQLNYNPAADCGYGKGWGGDIFMPENSKNEDGSLTAEGDLFSKICSETGRAYDLTEYVNDTNRRYTEVLTAYTVNSEATESYSYAGNQRLSRNNIWNEARGVDHNETSYYLYDGRGSVTANTWQNGMVTEVYQYDPYGQVTHGSAEHTDFYGYNGENYNPNTGLEYLRARYYNANQGRFFQEDTYLGDITDPLTLNRYAYVKNSPMNYVDPSGHKGKPIYLPNVDINKKKNENGKIFSYDAIEQNKSDVKKLEEAFDTSFEQLGGYNKLKNSTEKAPIESYFVSCDYSGKKVITGDMWQWDALGVIEELRQRTGYNMRGIETGISASNVSGNISIGFVVDKKGNIALVGGAGLNFGNFKPGVSVGIVEQEMLGVEDYSSIQGKSHQIGGGLSHDIANLGVELNIVNEGDLTYYGITDFKGVGVGGSPVEAHVGTSWGDVAPPLINYLDIMEDLIWSTVE